MFYVISFCVTIWSLAICFFLYRFMVMPFKRFKFYEKTLCKDYKVYVIPFSPLGYKIIENQKIDEELHGDCHYTLKTIYPKYQVVLSNWFSNVILDLIDPQLIKQFYDKTYQGCYQKCSLVSEPLRQFLGNGLLLSEGHQFKIRKKIISNVFNYKFIDSKIPAIIKICEEEIQRCEQKLVLKDGKLPIIVNHLLQEIFGNVIIKCFFGTKMSEKINGENIFSFINDTLTRNITRIYSVPSMIFGIKFDKLGLRSIDRECNQKLSALKKYTLNIIEKKVDELQKQQKSLEQSNQYNDVIDYLIHENKLKKNCEEAEKNTKQFYTFQDLVDEFTTFFIAGTDTTSNASTALIYLLATHPEVERKVREEIETVLKNKKENINEESLKKMVYLENALKETLRMHASFTGIMIRVATKDHMLGNIPIVKGTYVYLKSKSNHYKEENFENRFEFKPERWESIDITKMKPYSYFPFSAGLRSCPGQHLSMIEMKIVVSMLLMRYKSMHLQKKDFKFIQKITFAPEDLITTFEKAV